MVIDGKFPKIDTREPQEAMDYAAYLEEAKAIFDAYADDGAVPLRAIMLVEYSDGDHGRIVSDGLPLKDAIFLLRRAEQRLLED